MRLFLTALINSDSSATYKNFFFLKIKLWCVFIPKNLFHRVRIFYLFNDLEKKYTQIEISVKVIKSYLSVKNVFDAYIHRQKYTKKIVKFRPTLMS